jgi:hypothetical protein
VGQIEEQLIEIIFVLFEVITQSLTKLLNQLWRKTIVLGDVFQ